MTRNVIREELGRSGRKGGEYRGKSTGYHNLASRNTQRLKALVTSAPAVLELEQPTSSHGGYRGGFTRKPTGDNNDSDDEYEDATMKV